MGARPVLESLQDLAWLAGGLPVALLVGAALAIIWWQGWLSRGLVVLLLVIAILPIFGGSGDASEGSPLRQVTWGGLFLYSLCIVAQGDDGRFELPLRWVPLSLWVLLAYCLATVMWSPVAEASFKRWVQVTGVAILAMALFRSGRGEPLYERLFWPALVLSVLGLGNLVVNPGYAIDVEGCFRGIASHKNTWGQFCLLGGLAALTRAFARERDWLAWGVFLLCAVSVLLSKSSSSTLMLLAITGLFALWYLWTLPGRIGKAIVTLGGGGTLLAIYLYFVFQGDASMQAIADAGLGTVGKNSTLTGRTFLWELIRGEIAKHPWLGVGYGGFWMGMAGPSAAVIVRLDWGPPWQSHNGYLDVINEIGYLGLGLTVLMLLQQAWNLLKFSRGPHSALFMFHVAILVATVVGNITETSLVRTTHFWWILFVASLVEVQARLLRQPELYAKKSP